MPDKNILSIEWKLNITYFKKIYLKKNNYSIHDYFAHRTNIIKEIHSYGSIACNLQNARVTMFLGEKVVPGVRPPLYNTALMGPGVRVLFRTLFFLFLIFRTLVSTQIMTPTRRLQNLHEHLDLILNCLC